MDTRTIVAPDGGWGWVVVIAAFLNMVVSTSTFFAFPVLFAEWKRSFHSSSSSVALLGSLVIATSYGFSVISGALVHKFGHRPIAMCGSFIATMGLFSSSFTSSINHLYLTYGLLAGVGISMVMAPSLVIGQQYFDKYRVMASYIVICGLSTGGLLAGPVMRMLLDNFAWRGALIIHAGIILHGVVFSCAFRPLPKVTNKLTVEKETEAESESSNKPSLLRRLFCGFFDCTLWVEVKFTLFCIACFCMSVGYFSIIHHMVNYAMSFGVEKHHAAFMPTVSGVGALSSRIIFGIISNHPKINRPLQFALAAVLQGTLIVAALLGRNMPAICVIAFSIGFCGGMIEALKPTLCVDVVGVSRVANAVGMQNMCVGVGILIGSPFAGFLLDSTGDYLVPFIVLGTIVVIGGGFMMADVFIIHRERTRLPQELQVEIS